MMTTYNTWTLKYARICIMLDRSNNSVIYENLCPHTSRGMFLPSPCRIQASQISTMNVDNKCTNICIVDNCGRKSNYGPHIYSPLATGIFIYKTPGVHVFMMGTTIQLSGILLCNMPRMDVSVLIWLYKLFLMNLLNILINSLVVLSFFQGN